MLRWMVLLAFLVIWPGEATVSRMQVPNQNAETTLNRSSEDTTCRPGAAAEDLAQVVARLAFAQTDNRCCWIERVPCTEPECETVLWYSCDEGKFYWYPWEFQGPKCEVRIVGDWRYQRQSGECEEAPPNALCLTGCDSAATCVLEDALYAYRGSQCDCPNDPELNRVLNLFQYNKEIRYECLCPPPQFGG